jgi:hypothetical protein
MAYAIEIAAAVRVHRELTGIDVLPLFLRFDCADRRGDLLHENIIGLDQEVAWLLGQAYGDMVVGHVDDGVMGDEPVCGG